jgi:hypothetical protein
MPVVETVVEWLPELAGVAAAGRGRKGNLQRGEEGWKEKRGESHGGCFVAGWLPVVELVFVVVYRLGLLVFSSEKAAVAEVERAAEG